MADPVLIAAVEGGGTSFVVAVAEFFPNNAIDGKSDDGNIKNTNNMRILHRDEIDSSHENPSQTLKQCVSFFQKHKTIRKEGYAALGVGMFGPFGCNPKVKEHYGTVLSTSPKKKWRGVDVLSPLVEACDNKPTSATKRKLAVKIDTDVNAPAIAEFLSEIGKGQEIKLGDNEKEISSLAYVTVGTGVGVGLVIHGKTVHGRMHPEGGHVPVQPLQGDKFSGYSWGTDSCSPFQGKHTVESMTSSVALIERLEQFQRQTNALATSKLDRDCLADIDDDNHELWNHAANALANLCITLALVASVEKIVLGGGIMKRNGLIEKVRRQTRVLLNGYLGELSDQELSDWIVLSSHGSDAGIVGAFVLAQQALAENKAELVEVCADERKIASDSTDRLKQASYNTGLCHGIAIGLSALYIGLVVYTRHGKSSSY